MRLWHLMFILVFLAGHLPRVGTTLLALFFGYVAAVAEHEMGEPDSFELGLNPSDFLPLEVGNRWTFTHEYLNDMYGYDPPDNMDEETKAYLREFEVPGYPFEEESNHPPNSLTHSEPADLTVEITHTEWISGEDYFVFSEPSYSWPPLPKGFLAGKKVRWLEGILVFNEEGSDVPLYDFSTSSERYEYEVAPAIGLLPVRVWIVRRMTDSLTFIPNLRDHLDILITPANQGQVLEVEFRLNSPLLNEDWKVLFVKGYGLGQWEQKVYGLHYSEHYSNVLKPVSVLLSGKQASYEEATRELVTLMEPELPPIVGQRDTLYSLGGFDFSKGQKLNPKWLFDEENDDIEFWQRIDPNDGLSLEPEKLVSLTGLADLGRVDFTGLVSTGPPDLQKDPRPWSVIPQELNTYAFWTQEGGIALMNVLDVVRSRIGSGIYIVFDWVYYPPSEDSTIIQSLSWGELKNLLR